MKKDSVYCCDYLQEKITEKDAPVRYSHKFREFYLHSIKDDSISFTIDFCPWCGSHFPKNLRDDFFETLNQEYNIATNIFRFNKEKSIPPEFKTDEWWKKRGL